jgi:hypothetical protein
MKMEEPMAQKTKLTLEQIIQYLKDAIEPENGEEAEEMKNPPLLLLVHELGEIFWGGGDVSPKAEEKLIELLGHRNQAARWIAYRYLYDTKRPLSGAGAAKFADFCEDPDNVRVTEPL